DLFVRIKSFFTSHFGRFDTLAIDDGNTWFGVATGLDTYVTADQRIDKRPGALIPPFPIIVPNMIPIRALLRQHAPLTAGFDAIEDGIEHFTNIDRTFLPTSVRLCDLWRKDRKFLVIEITCVAFAWVWSSSLRVVATRHCRYLQSSSDASVE